ncbi:hypothetical protein HGRIS_014083 [Hohenbuehelia grisea]|uniref:Peptidase A2 domain-containing protein n=1 Tax=Hohenbuehelia grisea TaxID=104357 RepID=A0ABR3JT45_9AGAR
MPPSKMAPVVVAKKGIIKDAISNHFWATQFDPQTLVALPNTSDGKWEALTTKVFINGIKLPILALHTAILDTGAAMMIVPPRDAMLIY